MTSNGSNKNSNQASFVSANTRLVRFLGTGILNTAFGFALYAALVWIGLIPHVAQLIGRIVGLVFNYMTYGRFVFADKRLSKTRYLLGYLANYAAAALILVGYLFLFSDAYIAGLATILTSAVLNYFVLSRFVALPKLERTKAKYRPYPRDWSGMPEWFLLVKDTLHDLGHKLHERAIRTAPGRLVWMMLEGRHLRQQIEDSGFLFVHLPKTGGTSISRDLYGRNLPHYRAPSWLLRYPDDFHRWHRFALLRDPVSRFVSAWRFTKSGGTNMILSSRFERFRLGKIDQIEDLVTTLEQNPELIEEIVTFRSQSSFLVNSVGELMVDRLFAIDSGPHVSKELAKLLGMPDIPHLNKSSGAPIVLDADLETRIRHLYSKDVELYDQVLATGGSWVQNGTPNLARDAV